ncbi:hypothetical protein [Phnomibacter sp.]|uniref:hypothetical protein n=1 Tax=Phnomibacter sp. TaxID=2836217 RepID=UPI002FDDB7A0
MQSFNHEYAAYLKYLVQKGILECDNQYIPEQKSKGYRFTAQYRNSDLQQIKITKPAICKKLDAEYFSGRKAHPELARWFNYKLRLNYTKAVERNEQFYHENWDIHEPKLLSKYEHNKYKLTEFSNQSFYFQQDEFAGRIHSNLSNLPKIFRPYVTYDKQPLVCVDIKNSQPYLLTRILQPNFFDKAARQLIKSGLLYASIADIAMLETKQRKAIATKKKKGKCKNTPDKLRSMKQAQQQAKKLYENIQQSVASIPEQEMMDYKSAALGGTLYEMFIQRYTMETGLIIEKPQAKLFFLKTLFSSPRWGVNNLESGKAIMSKMFPSIFQVIEMSKMMYKNYLACLLQSMESNIILHRVATRIAWERPNLPLFTIHDSIVTTLGNQDYVNNVLLEECLQATGFLPATSIEIWTPEMQSMKLAA